MMTDYGFEPPVETICVETFCKTSLQTTTKKPIPNFYKLQNPYTRNPMAEKFRGKYRIPSNRYKNWDYRNNGYYFITICTQNREHFFGKIVDDQMVLNELGEIVHTQWYASEKIRQNIFLDQFVIMPNHIHGIVIIDNNDNIGRRDVWQNVSTKHHPVTDVLPNVSTQTTANPKNKFMAEISPSSNSLSMMIRQFKSAVTRHARQIMPQFGWQRNYYDHIIRNEKSLEKIQEYIFHNPAMWHRDRNNDDGLWV